MNIQIIGSGALATALGHVITSSKDIPVLLISIEKNVVEDINKKNLNPYYFPSIPLSKKLTATTDTEAIKHADILFTAIPSVEVFDYLNTHSSLISEKCIIVNLAKGFTKDHHLIVDKTSTILNNPICSMKGPSFSRELISLMPTSFTIGSKKESIYKTLSDLFSNTCIHLDYSSDIVGVELLSILKNIYAISMGIIDANFISANLRFYFITKAINEIRKNLLLFGGQSETLFNYCGFGDFALTALNDLSRNRTLGLLMGKGFFTSEISDKVTLEGKIATFVLAKKLKEKKIIQDFPIVNELDKVFKNQSSIKQFISKVI